MKKIYITASIPFSMPPRKTAAIDSSRIFLKYYKIDDNKTIAVMAGSCKRCRKITDLCCSKCRSFVCEKHLYKKHEKLICYMCRNEGCEPLTKKEIGTIRGAELKL